MKGIRQRGSSTVEFIVVAPVLAALGLGTVQAGLVYHGNTILNYATFEAARTGAVNHALEAPMLEELGTRLAPLQGGDGSAGKAALAIATSRAMTLAQQGGFTHIEVLNPTREAFEHFKVRSRESGLDVIPNSHLRFQDAGIDAASGVNLQDANLLKIRVTHGFDLQVPVISQMVGAVMSVVDPGHAHYYAAGKLPLTSVATVRMQSEVYGDSLRSASAPPAAIGEALVNAAPQADDTPEVGSGGVGDEPGDDPGDGTDDVANDIAANDGGTSGCPDAGGSDPVLPVISEQSCDVAYGDASAVESDLVTTVGNCG